LIKLRFSGQTAEVGLENVPAESANGLAITQPAIYYGQSMSGYRIVASGTKEFDYPKGNDNLYASYAGTGGIPVDSLLRRILFAWNQGDINILLTAYRSPGWRRAAISRIMERPSSTGFQKTSWSTVPTRSRR
jgi:uncharacterized membrane protein (UPF0182 family)